MPVEGGFDSKPLRWVGSSQEDLRNFPAEVRRRVGGALWDAQLGLKAPYVRPLKGFGDAGVLEIARRLRRAREESEQWPGSGKTILP